MIGYINGSVSHIYDDYCFINVNGIGYRIFVPASTRQKLAVGSTVFLFTYLNVREDALLLFGFLTTDEYQLFMNLVSVTGIGPKVALSILSSISVSEFRLAVSQKNITVLTKIPGIGKKMGERIILELKDKLGTEEETEAAGGIHTSGDGADSPENSAWQALESLGYSPGEIMPALKKYSGLSLTVEELIKRTLKELSGR